MFARRFTRGAPRGRFFATGDGSRAPRPWRDVAHAAALLLLASSAAPAAAQRMFDLDAWTGFAELRFGVQEQDTEARDGRSTRFDRQVSEERLALRNTLTIVGRKFLVVNYGFTVGLTQADVGIDRQQEQNEGTLRAFDVTATLRPVSRHPVTLLYHRAVTETPVDFVGVRELLTDSLGLNVGVGPAWLPGSIRIRESRLESTSDFGRFVRAVDQQRRRLEYTAANRWPRHQVNLSYLLEDLEDRIAPDFSHLSQTLHVNHRFEILAPRLATLSSVVRYFDRGGTLATSSLYLDEVLRLQHRKNLATSVRYVAQQIDSFSGPPADSQQLVAELHHRLYDSLETDVFFGTTRTTSSRGLSDLDELGFDAVYSKKLPAAGNLRARLNSRYDTRDSRRGDGQELVTGERHVVRFGVPARLERAGVIQGTVVVTDALRSIIYQEGVDYELLLVGDFAEITPLVGGRIRDGQEILVEYRVAAPAGRKYTAQRTGFDLWLDYGWIAPFWGYRSIDYDLVEGVSDRLLEDQEDQFFGVRLRRAGRRLKLTSFNEVRIRDSSLQSFETLRLGESLTWVPQPRWTVRLNLVYLTTDFTVPVRETRVTEGRLRVHWTPRPTLSLEAYASSRLVEDSRAADQTFERYGLEGRWTFGKISVLASVEEWQRGREQAGVELEQLRGLFGSLRISRRIFPGRVSVPRRRSPVEPWPANLPGLWAQPPPGEEAAERPEPKPQETAAASTAAASTTPSDVVVGDAAEWQALCRAGLGGASPIAVSLSAFEVAASAPERAEAQGSPDALQGEDDAIRRTVAAWAEAWSEQRVDHYLAFYGEAFRASGFVDRAAWERRRRELLTRPGLIRVELSALDVEVLEPGRARARFRQSYRSEVFADVVAKTLELRFEDGGWKIFRERVGEPLAGP